MSAHSYSQLDQLKHEIWLRESISDRLQFTLSNVRNIAHANQAERALIEESRVVIVRVLTDVAKKQWEALEQLEANQ